MWSLVEQLKVLLGVVERRLSAAGDPGVEGLLDVENVPAHLLDSVAVDLGDVLGGSDEDHRDQVRHSLKDVPADCRNWKSHDISDF